MIKKQEGWGGQVADLRRVGERAGGLTADRRIAPAANVGEKGEKGER